MRAWEEQSWSMGRRQEEVIRQAGRAIARRALDLTGAGEKILVLAGRGHNGDDARRAAAALPKSRVTLLEVTDPETARGLLRAELSEAPALLIDGLFGIGLNRPLDASWCELIELINRSGVRVLAVDVPSGLDADSGMVRGAAIYAAVTVTLGAPKRGLLAPAAANHVGRLEVAPEIGLIPCPHAGDVVWTLPADFFRYPPVRPVSSHKGMFGHVALLAGNLGYHGAAVLCARGALRAQPGLVTVFTTEAAYGPVASQLQAAMVRPWRQGTRATEPFSSFVLGPGLAGADVPADLRAEAVRLWQSAPVPVVVDASALDWLPRGATPPGKLRVITPHPGEAARLLYTLTENIAAGRVEATRELSRRYGGCWAVLKGHQTLIGSSGGTVFVNSTGNPGLAQGGSGDVLAGYLGGLLAQPALARDPLLAIRYGVWQHGAAADWLAERGPVWGIEELAGVIGNARP